MKHQFAFSNRTRIQTTLTLSTLGLSVGVLYSQNSEIKTKPNVIFILADDFGYTDVNCFATRVTNTPADKQYYETPNIDKLARQGLLSNSIILVR